MRPRIKKKKYLCCKLDNEKAILLFSVAFVPLNPGVAVLSRIQLVKKYMSVYEYGNWQSGNIYVGNFGHPKLIVGVTFHFWME